MQIDSSTASLDLLTCDLTNKDEAISINKVILMVIIVFIVFIVFIVCPHPLRFAYFVLTSGGFVVYNSGICVLYCYVFWTTVCLLCYVVCCVLKTEIVYYVYVLHTVCCVLPSGHVYCVRPSSIPVFTFALGASSSLPIHFLLQFVALFLE